MKAESLENSLLKKIPKGLQWKTILLFSSFLTFANSSEVNAEQLKRNFNFERALHNRDPKGMGREASEVFEMKQFLQRTMTTSKGQGLGAFYFPQGYIKCKNFNFNQNKNSELIKEIFEIPNPYIMGVCRDNDYEMFSYKLDERGKVNRVIMSLVGVPEYQKQRLVEIFNKKEKVKNNPNEFWEDSEAIYRLNEAKIFEETQKRLAEQYAKERNLGLQEKVISNTLEKDFYVEGGEKWNNKTVRKISFNAWGRTNPHESNHKQTYILIHGWNANPKVFSSNNSKNNYVNLAETIRQKDKNAQIILLDWSDITNTGRIDVKPRKESTWIISVRDMVANVLVKWDIKPENTSIIGHSLGALLGSETVKVFGDIKQFIALDPAEDGLFNYEIDNKGNKFNGFNKRGRCFVSNTSIAGSEELIHTCKEKYIMALGSIIDRVSPHSWTRATFNEMIKNPFIDHKLSLKDDTVKVRHDRLKSLDLDGIIYSEWKEPSKIKYLKRRINYSNSKMEYALYGNTKLNKIECVESSNCKAYGGEDADMFSTSIFSKGNLKIEDFNENEGDVIKIKKRYLVKNSLRLDRIYQNGDYIVIPTEYANFDLQSKPHIWIKGVNLKEVGDWIKIALEDKNKRPDKKRKNSIIIE